MKKVLLVLLAGVAALLGVMVARTLAVPAPAEPAAASKAVAVDEATAAARLSGAVKFATVSYASGAPIDTAAFLGFHDFLATSFPKVHATLKRETVAGLSLVYTWTGTDSTAAPVVLMGHMDVVPVPEPNLKDWTHAPFSGDVPLMTLVALDQLWVELRAAEQASSFCRRLPGDRAGFARASTFLAVALVLAAALALAAFLR